MILDNLKLTTALTVVLTGNTAVAGELPIGDPVERYGMEIAAIYLQAVRMEPMMAGMSHDGDIHLEADIHALERNPNGFAAGEWVPYLGVGYELSKVDSDWTAKGELVPMVASDGPHYGANIKLDGPGKYHVEYHITPPSQHGFYRHTDKETGVGAWWQPIDLEWDFTYVGSTGKKGGY